MRVALVVMFALSPTAGKLIVAVWSFTSSCEPVAVGSYLTRIPVAVTTTMFGTVMLSEATFRPNLPGTLNALSSADGFCSACTA